jgi:hypothetical protein
VVGEDEDEDEEGGVGCAARVLVHRMSARILGSMAAA